MKPLENRLRKQFEAIYLDTKVASMQAAPQGIVVTLEGRDVPAQETFDRVLVSVGRRPNSAGMGLENTKIQLDERGFIKVDPQRRTTDPNIFAIGDVAGEPGLAHKATAEAKVVVEMLLGEPTEFAPAHPGSSLYRSGIGVVRADGARCPDAEDRLRQDGFPLVCIGTGNDLGPDGRDDQALG